jgi:hypothetical protein
MGHSKSNSTLVSASIADETKRQGQLEALLALLRSRVGQWVSLPEVIEAAGCQYGARVHFARHKLSLPIENKRDGGYSYFRLKAATPAPPAPTPSTNESDSSLLFPAEPVTYRDPEEDSFR